MARNGHNETSGRRPPLVARGASAALLGLALLAFLHSLDWRGTSFPGFFVMPNRVVPSAGLPDWSGVREGRPLYQQVVLAVDGDPVPSGAEVYRRAALHRPGEPVEYLLAHAGGVETRSFPLRRFGDGEYLAIFGAYLVTGLAYLLLAALAAERWREAPVYRGLAAIGWAGAAFGFTGIDLYGPGVLFRLHVLAEACLPAAAAHLALVCPRNHVARRPGLLLLTYGLAIGLAAVYELFLGQPSAYTPIHNVAQALAGLPVFGLAVTLALAIGERPPETPTADVRLMLGATLAGVLVPGIVLAISGASGGRLPVNVSAWTGFLFPLGCIAAFRLRPGWGAALLGPGRSATLGSPSQA